MTEQNVDLITNLILDYFKAVKHVHEKPKLRKNEKLEQLLNPLIELNKFLAPLHSLNEYRLSWDGTYPFISERVEKDDLDLEHLDYDRDSYEINWCENERIRERRGPRIWKYEKLTEKEKRLREEVRSEEEARRGIELEDSLIVHEYPQDLYQQWLPTLDEEKIQSKDLLDQILVCYTIKRAINGDKKAIEKLYSLYEYAAETMGVRFALRNKLNVDEVKNTSRILLRFIIKGFSPEHILMDLLSDRKILSIPGLSIPGWLKDFFIYYLSQHLPPIIQDTLTEIGSIQRDVQRNRFIFLYFRLLAMLNPCTPIRDIPWKSSPVRIRRFNNYCFRSGIVKLGPRKNLTTWIFGRRKEIDTLTKAKREDGTVGKAWQPYGKLYQLIRDTYRPDIEKKKSKKNIDFNDDFDEDSQTPLDNMIDKEVVEKTIEKLSEYGISLRDIEIFTQRIFERIPQIELAEEYHLTTRQIRRICNQCKETLHSSLKSNLSSHE